MDRTEDTEHSAGVRSVRPTFAPAVAEDVVCSVPAARLALLAVAAAPVQEALRALAGVDLGETMPATSFDPSWDE